MNKYLVMTAAALAAVSTGIATDAMAKKVHTASIVVLTSMGYYRYCDDIHVGWNGSQSAQSDDLYTDCGYSFVSKGTGSIGNIKKVGLTMTNGDDQEAYFTGAPGNAGLAFEYTPSPSHNTAGTGTVSVYASTSCCSSFLATSHEYVIVGPGAHHAMKGKTSLVKSLIASGKVKLPAKKS